MDPDDPDALFVQVIRIPTGRKWSAEPASDVGFLLADGVSRTLYLAEGDRERWGGVDACAERFVVRDRPVRADEQTAIATRTLLC